MSDANLRYVDDVSWGEGNHCNKVNILATNLYFPNLHIYWKRFTLFYFNTVRFVLTSRHERILRFLAHHIYSVNIFFIISNFSELLNMNTLKYSGLTFFFFLPM